MKELEERLRDAIKEYGLEEYEEHFVKWLRPRYLLNREPMTDDGQVGVSKLGGLPDLPDSVEWPEYEGNPMSFLAQINLSEVTAASPQHPLPKTGLLSFFYDCKQDVWGISLKDKGGWKVFYFEEPFNELKQRPFPNDLPKEKHVRFRPLRVSYEFIGGDLPWGGYDPFARLNFSREMLWGKVDNMYDRFCPRVVFGKSGKDQPVHQLLGWWYSLQGGGNLDMECEIIKHGYTWRTLPKDKIEQFEDARHDWSLLLQLEGDPLNNMVWGDSGHLLFFINKKDLEQKCFDNVWMIFECC